MSGDGYVFVSDYPRCSVHILRTDGSYVNMIDGRRFGDKENFIHPAAVAVDFYGFILVTDYKSCLLYTSDAADE